MNVYFCRKIRLDCIDELMFDDPQCIVEIFRKSKMEAHLDAIKYLQEYEDYWEHNCNSLNSRDDLKSFSKDLEKCSLYLSKGKYKKANEMYKEMYKSYLTEFDVGFYIEVIKQEIM